MRERVADANDGPEGPRDETAVRRRLLELLHEHEIDLDFVALVAGDREPSARGREWIRRVREDRAERFHSDLIFALTHRRLDPEAAERQWRAFVSHKAALERALGREVRIAVAAIDYLSTHADECPETLQICPERRLTSLASAALRDGLTGLFDHRTCTARLSAEIERHRRYGHPVSLLLLDLDHFKTVNDRHGHVVGDDALRTFARILRRQTRRVATAGRYGGDEFVVLMPQARVADAVELAERLRRETRRTFAGSIRLTLSAGAASCPAHGVEARRLLEAADEALYRAKQTGRDRTCLPAAADS